jgi:hypothetical protein
VNRREAVALTKAVQAVCPHQFIDKDTPKLWWEVLKGFALADCLTVLAEIAQDHKFIGTEEIATAVRAKRRRRLADYRMPLPPPSLADDPDAERAWLRAARKAVADGHPRPELAAAQAVRTQLEAGR